ncbi:MAG TPA: hypothetical protein VD997_16740 [Phycisphaerales bacterium]|nr:hypothetical protein [Phycisphaerales bacterium]
MAADIEHAGEEHFSQERREWVIQRTAWAVMALILVAALLGLFGNGPLSKRVVESDPAGLRMEYQRIVRYQAQTQLKLRIDEVQGEEVTVTFGDGYFEHFELDTVVPEPDEQRSGDGQLVLVFKPARERGPVEVSVRAKVEKLGTIDGSVSVEGAGDVPRRLRFEQFALP